MEPPHWIPVVHCIECRHFVYSHGRHFKSPSDLVHDAYACEAMLPLPQIEERHYRSFLVLWRVSFEDLGDKLLIDRIEFEWYVQIVLWGVTMLIRVS